MVFDKFTTYLGGLKITYNLTSDDRYRCILIDGCRHVEIKKSNWYIFHPLFHFILAQERTMNLFPIVQFSEFHILLLVLIIFLIIILGKLQIIRHISENNLNIALLHKNILIQSHRTVSKRSLNNYTFIGVNS